MNLTLCTIHNYILYSHYLRYCYIRHLVGAERSNDTRIMLVDDDYDAVFTFKYALESYNYEVNGFTDPILALKTFSGEMLLFIIHKNTNAGLIKR